MLLITEKKIELDYFLNQIKDPSCGAIVTFLGVVRNMHNNRPVERIFYECYQTMALKMMQLIKAEVLEKWPDMQLVLVHRIGMVELTEASILAITSAPHRKEAFSANIYVMNRVKQILPIWKREYHPNNETSWVGIGS